MPKELLALGPVPGATEHVWAWFMELSNARQYTMAGAQAVSFQEIEAWSRLTGNRPTPWETELLCRLDLAFRSSLAKRRKKE